MPIIYSNLSKRVLRKRAMTDFLNLLISMNLTSRIINKIQKSHCLHDFKSVGKSKMCLKSFWEASARAKMKTYLLSVGKNLGAAKRKLNQIERLFTLQAKSRQPNGRRHNANYRTKVNECSSYLKSVDSASYLLGCREPSKLSFSICWFC